MTIQKTSIQFKNKSYEVILEDGLVSYVDPRKPELRKNIMQSQGQKITSMEGAKRLALQSLERTIIPNMRFSD